MADLEGTFVDDAGQTRLDGHLHVPAGVSADQVNGVSINNTPGGAALYLRTSDASNCAWHTLAVRIAAGVPAGAPTADELPIAVDTTAVSGGIYAWSGAAWVKAASI